MWDGNKRENFLILSFWKKSYKCKCPFLIKTQSLIIIISLQSGFLPLSKYFPRRGTHCPQEVHSTFGELMFRMFFLTVTWNLFFNEPPWRHLNWSHPTSTRSSYRCAEAIVVLGSSLFQSVLFFLKWCGCNNVHANHIIMPRNDQDTLATVKADQRGPPYRPNSMCKGLALGGSKTHWRNWVRSARLEFRVAQWGWTESHVFKCVRHYLGVLKIQNKIKQVCSQGAQGLVGEMDNSLLQEKTDDT